MRMKLFVALASLAAALAFAASASAQISRHYIKLCGPGEYAVGLHAGVGSWINRVHAMCAKWDRARGALHTVPPPH